MRTWVKIKGKKFKLGDKISGFTYGRRTDGALVRSEFGTFYLMTKMYGRTKLIKLDIFRKIQKTDLNNGKINTAT